MAPPSSPHALRDHLRVTLASGALLHKAPEVVGPAVDALMRKTMDRLPALVQNADNMFEDWAPLLKVHLGEVVAAEAAKRLQVIFTESGIQFTSDYAIHEQRPPCADCSITWYVNVPSVVACCVDKAVRDVS